jgi:hypothetical protein
VVQTEVLSAIGDSSLAVYAVWEPILRTDDERSSRKATALFPDRRVTNYWVDSPDVGKAFQEPIGLVGGPAWDVYLVYPPGAQWTVDTPPRPEFFMHQLGGRLPDDRSLDGSKLAEAIRKLLPE